MAICALLGPKVLPDRPSRLLPPDLSRYAATIAEHYDLRDGFYRLRVREQSPLIGVQASGVDLSDYTGVELIGVQARGEVPALVREALDVDDVLIVSGPSAEISELAMREVLAVAMRPLTDARESLVNREMGVAELVVPPGRHSSGRPSFPAWSAAPSSSSWPSNGWAGTVGGSRPR